MPDARPARRPDRDRPALRRRPGDHPAPGRGSSASRRARCTPAGAMIMPSAVLFNGGVFKAVELRQRVLDVLSELGRPAGPGAANRPTSISRSPAARPTTARSAAARESASAAAPRAPTTSGSRPRRRPCPGVAPPIKALCVVPMGMEEGTEADVPGPELGLVVGEPAEFRFLGSTTRRDDPVGTMVDAGPRGDPGARPARDGARGRRRHRPARWSRSACTRRSPRSARSSSGARHPRRPPLEARIQRPRALAGVIRAVFASMSPRRVRCADRWRGIWSAQRTLRYFRSRSLRPDHVNDYEADS